MPSPPLHRVLVITSLSLGLATACADSAARSTISITPGEAGSVQIEGPLKFSARPASEGVSWSVLGAGTVTPTKGPSTLFTPPPGRATSTLIATLGGATATVKITSTPTRLPEQLIAGLGAPVTVQYDPRNVPHIVCGSQVDCYAVQGYLHAQDRLFQMDVLRHIARGRLAELVGVGGLAQDVQFRTLFVTRAGHRIEDDLAAALDTDTRAVVEAYTRGVNAFLGVLRSHNATLPGEYSLLPIATTAPEIADWTIQDSLAIGRLQQFQLSETLTKEIANGGFAATFGPGAAHEDAFKMNVWIRAAAPPTEQAHTIAQPVLGQRKATISKPPRLPALAGWQGVLHTLAHPTPLAGAAGALRELAEVGSNNWVISAGKSSTGHALLANDPHLPLNYPPTFHLIGLTSARAADGLDAIGGGIPGIPGLLLGRGAHVGWGVTVVGYDVTDVYLEQFLPQASCPTPAPCVLWKGAPTPTIAVPQSYRARVAPGPGGVVDVASLHLPAGPPPFVLIVPPHGPVLQAPDAAGRAVAFRWTGHEGWTQDVRAILRVAVATDVDTAAAALRDFGVGAQNFVLADDQGHIGYTAPALVPVRPFTQGAAPLAPWFPIPGNGAAEWGDGQADCAAARAIAPGCWIDLALLPHGKDPAQGYFFTANADPLGVSDDNNPLAHPPYLSFDWDDSSGFRATRIKQLLDGELARTGKLSPAAMEAFQRDHVSRLGMALAPAIARAQVTSPSVETAQKILAQWGAAGFDCPTGLVGSDPAGPVDPSSAASASGCFLFHAFVRALVTNVFGDDLAVAKQPVTQVAAVKAILFLLALPDGATGTTFCHDVDPHGDVLAIRTCGSQVSAALAQAVDTLSQQVDPKPANWIWGRSHTMRPISLSPLVDAASLFSPGPFARAGGTFTVDVGNVALAAPGTAFPMTNGSNVRHVSEMTPAATSARMQLPGPERDAPVTDADAAPLTLWLGNRYFDLARSNAADAQAVAVQVFRAQ